MLPAKISAQAGQSELVGEITDANGANIQGARVLLTEKQTARTIETISDGQGNFIFTNQNPGLYWVRFEANGFTPLVREGVTLTTGERIRIDTQLQVITLDSTVTINADAALLRSETSSLGQVIDNKKIVDLPINGRNFLSLVGLAPGVAQPPRTTEGASLPRINGGRPRTNEYLFDGISVLQPEPGQVAFFPIIDAIQEFKVEINNPPAEFGRFNGGVINLTTKAETNDFHGSIFEFFRNEVLNARNLFAPVNQPKPVFRRNQFGGVLGGRIIKDKTFFFVDYQGTRQLVGRIRISTVPTLANRSGNFSTSLGALLYRTSSGTVTTTATGNTPILVTDTNNNQIQARQNQIFRPLDKLAYAGNIVPLSDFDSSALRLLQRYPIPTATGDIPNVFVASFTYDFNLFKSSSGVAGKFLKGWSANGIINVQSGIPLAVTQVTNFNAFAGFGTQRPNIISNPNLPGKQRTTAQWFDVSAFTVAPQFTIGNASRNPVRGPGYRNFDLTIIKRTNLNETTNIEFRTEIFNLTNTPPLNAPNIVLGSAGFGSITSAGDPRVIQFGLKLNF